MSNRGLSPFSALDPLLTRGVNLGVGRFNCGSVTATKADEGSLGVFRRTTVGGGINASYG